MKNQRIIGIENGMVVSVPVNDVNNYRGWTKLNTENSGEFRHRSVKAERQTKSNNTQRRYTI
tara:strand:- start:1862 stop:2047 length:186 start_codon:yes stop_codon:yes gene_type:complete